MAKFLSFPLQVENPVTTAAFAAVTDEAGAETGRTPETAAHTDSRKKENEMKMSNPPRGVRFGFSGPDNRIMSFNVPAADDYGAEHPFYSFEVEYDPEEPDRLVICLMELDEDRFVRVARSSVPFSAWHLADLVTKRKATEEEEAAWKDAPDE
ncbi:hypothetical protein [Microvirga roseola]|uniref:hypothetical protein n=1 Tax=Microvirga roseola TaxID=2883126 RepID=UPI001E35714C|nr:hypothetical protein [Microvirga roseola]